MGRIYTAAASARSNQTWTTRNLLNIHEVWRTDSGVDTSSSNTWTGLHNGLILSQATASKRPALATNQLNGFSALAWDGVDDWLTLASFSKSAPFGFLLVFKITAQTAVSNHDTIVETGVVGTAPSQSLDSTPQTVLNAGASITYNAAPLTATTGYSAMLSYINGASSFIAENDNTRISGNAGSGGTTRLNLGNNNAGTRGVTISVVEFAVFGTLGGDERARIFDYTRSTYGLAGS